MRMRCKLSCARRKLKNRVERGGANGGAGTGGVERGVRHDLLETKGGEGPSVSDPGEAGERTGLLLDCQTAGAEGPAQDGQFRPGRVCLFSLAIALAGVVTLGR